VVGTEKNATDVNNAAALSRSILTPKGWSWQEKHGFVQGRALSPDGRTIYIAGQASVDDKGNPINKGNIEAQFVQALTNLEAVVAEAGGTLANVVKVTYFTTDIDRFFQGEKVLVKHLLAHNCLSHLYARGRKESISSRYLVRGKSNRCRLTPAIFVRLNRCRM